MLEEPSMDKEFIRKLNETMEANLSIEKFGVDELAREMGLSRSALLRRLKQVIGKSVNQFIREARLLRAMEMLEKNVAPVSEIAFRVGFSSPAYFTTCFHEYFGYPPGEVKKREPAALVAVVEIQEQSQENTNQIRKRGAINKIVLFGNLFFLVILFGWLFYVRFPEKSVIASSVWLKNYEKSIAVLPFKNLSNDPENQYFADGMMEEIVNNLCQVKELKVISRTSVEQFRENTKLVPEVGKILGVNYIVEGSVQQFGGKKKIIVQLINARSDIHIWSWKFDVEMVDKFRTQSEIAKQIAGKLQASISPEEIARIEKLPTRNPEAYNYYMQGRFYIRKVYTEETIFKSLEYYGKATALDPDYALAWIGQAEAYFLLTLFDMFPKPRTRPDGYEIAKKMVLRALEIDKNLSDAHAYLGVLLFYEDWDWTGAEKELNQAIRLDPSNVKGHRWLAEIFYITGRFKESNEEINKAIKFDPLFHKLYYIRAEMLYDQGKFEESLNSFQIGRDIIHLKVGRNWTAFKIYLRQDKGSKAVEELQNIMLKDTATAKFATVVKDVYTQSGEKGLINWLIEFELHNTHNPGALATLYAWIGQKKKALEYLELALNINSPDILNLIVSIDMNSLHQEPEFLLMVDKLGLRGYYDKMKFSE